MDATRNARAYSQTVFELSGQPYDPDDPELHTACSQTCRNLLAGVSTVAWVKAKRALEVVAWGRRRWNIEGGFRVEKHGGFGLEHTFCNDDTAGRNCHVLMQIAYALWQVFDTGVLSLLSDGCRKPTQEMWAKLLFLALLVIGLASVPRVEAGKFRMRRFHIVA